jgi:hypothetical protein
MTLSFNGEPLGYGIDVTPGHVTQCNVKYLSLHKRTILGDMRTQIANICDKVTAYEMCLLKLYGAVIQGRDLHHVLGYSSGDAFRQAVCRKTLPVQTFKRPGFRMRFARTHDIAIWLASMDIGGVGTEFYSLKSAISECRDQFETEPNLDAREEDTQ